MVDDRQLPHFLFYGPPGTGKTTTILAMAHRLFGPAHYRSYVVELNASDDRGIDVVRNNIIKFAESLAIDFEQQRVTSPDNFKLIILDEADAMTKDAQNALKRMHIHSFIDHITIVIYSSRRHRKAFPQRSFLSHLQSFVWYHSGHPVSLHQVISIKFGLIGSRFPFRFRFPPLAKEQIMPRLDYVIGEEKLNVTEDGKEALYNLSGGDMRKILNVLQSTSLAFDVVNEKNVYACVGQPNPEIIKRILKILLTETIEQAIEREIFSQPAPVIFTFSEISQIQVDHAISVADILENITDHVLALKFHNENISAVLIERLSETQKRIKNGCSEGLQLNALVSAFVLAREEIFA